MAEQPPLFVETIYDALRSIVAHIGGPKAAGHALRPDMPLEDARVWILNCCNPERPEKFDATQIIMLFRLAREAGWHVAKHYFDAETGYVPSEPADPKVEQEKLVATIEHATQELHRAVDALDKLRGRGSLKAIA